MIYTLFLTLFFAILPLQDTSKIAFNTKQQPDAQAVLNKGLDAEADGNCEGALEIWLEAKPALSEPSLAIGRNYIRVATNHNLKKYYKAASAMYFWGLSGESIDKNREALKTELAFMDSLLDKQVRKKWEQLLEDNNAALFGQIRRWWNALDPAPGTLTNERLIEHWQRIAHSRKHFTRADNSPYGTDARGTAWVAYGKPDRIFTERLHLSLNEAKRIAAKFRGGAEANAIANASVSMQPYPELSVWVYLDGVAELNENLVLMFGQRAAGGYGKIEVVEELIPNHGFTQSNRYAKFDLQAAQAGGNPVRAGKVNPGMVLQWAYYRELSTKDYYFSNIFEEMAFEWEKINNPYFDKHIGQAYKQKHKHQKVVIRAKAPKQSSSLGQDFPSVPLEPHQYALLDENSNPVFATFLISRPQHTFLEDLALNQDSMIAGRVDTAALQEAFASYQLFHGLTLRGPDGGRLGGARNPAILKVNGEDLDTPSHSAFVIPWKSGTQQTFYVELRNNHHNSESIMDKRKPDVGSPFPKEVRGVGTVTVEQPEPMEPTPGKLQLAQPILGWDIDANPGGLVPFWVAHNKKIPQGEPLAVHMEVYHLQQDTEGLYGFDLNYSILPVNWLGWTKERKDALSITVNFEHDRPHFTEDLEIKSADLEPGRYVLRMNATDNYSTNKAYREVEFEVVEKDAE